MGLKGLKDPIGIRSMGCQINMADVMYSTGQDRRVV